jgi:UDP-N-acetylmuramoyl-tripeptide--D-alanyl-D-alanine ligase
VEKIEQIYERFIDEGSIVVTDSRKITTKGGMFFALSGPNFNGNKFAMQALDLGCSVAVIDDDSFYEEDDRMILVKDSLLTLQHLANHHRKQFTIPVFAITGSNGKTTTKELLHACFETKWKTHSTKGNLNNHIGVPITLLELSKEDEIAIIEMGTNNPGEIAALAKIAEPTDALITSIGKAHLEGLGSLEGVAIEKLSLFDNVRKSNGKLFCNLGSPFIKNYVERYPEIDKIVYEDGTSDLLSVKLIQSFPRIEAIVNDDLKINSSLFGAHNLTNIAAALTVADSFGLDLGKCVDSLNNLVLENNRTQTIKKESGTTIYLDAYNANPTSMAAAIAAFSESLHPEKWLVIGDMFELGKDEVAEHQSIINLIDQHQWDKVVLVGELFGQTNVDNSKQYFETTKDVKEWLSQQSVSNKEILIKASRSMKLESLLEVL